jgi:hypothetical protein
VFSVVAFFHHGEHKEGHKGHKENIKLTIMKNRRSFLMLFICTFPFIALAQKEKPSLDSGQCITIFKKNHFACGDASDLTVTIKNICSGGTLDGKVYIEKNDGNWYSAYFADLKYNETKDDFWTCYSTGKVIVYRAKHGAATIDDYPSEQAIREKFGTKK